MSEQQPSYFAVIPASVRYDKSIPPAAKLLYGEITALATKEGFCWANNAYFGQLYDVHKNTAGNWINLLEKGGHIRCDYVKNSKNDPVRHIFISADPSTKSLIPPPPLNEIIDTPSTISLIPLNEIIDTPLNEIVEHSNTVISNTSSNTEKEEELMRANATLTSQVEEMADQVAFLESALEETKKEKASHTGARPPKPPKPSPEELVFPFDSEEFMTTWVLFIEQAAQCKKNHTQRQAILKLLSDFDEEYAIGLMIKSIAGGYQGVVFTDTKENYERYLKQKNGHAKASNNGRSGKQSPTGSEFDDALKQFGY